MFWNEGSKKFEVPFHSATIFKDQAAAESVAVQLSANGDGSLISKLLVARFNEPFQNGTYSFIVTGVETKTIEKAKDSPIFMKVTVMVTKGFNIGSYFEKEFYFDGERKELTREFLIAVGYDIPFGPFRFQSDDLYYLEFQAECILSENKKNSLTVTKYLPASKDG